MWLTETRLFGALAKISMGLSPPPTRILPVITRVVAAFRASAPPTAERYLSRMASTVGAAAEGAAAGMGGCGGASESITGGAAAG